MANECNKITEQEALKILTGKNYVLLEEGQDVYDMKIVEEWRQLAEAYDSYHMNEALNLKEASEKAGKACKEYGEAINMVTDLGIVSVTKKEPSEVVAAKKYMRNWLANPDFDKCGEALNAWNILEKAQQEAIEALENQVGEATGDDMKGYNMCTPQLVQLDCRNESCAFHKDGSCTNNKPALTITGNKVTCWTERD